MRNLGLPVLVIKASYEGPTTESTSTKEGANLHVELPLCIRARIILVENLQTERGLVNGTLGSIHDFMWEDGANWQKDPPLAILVKFNNYDVDGPFITIAEDGKPIVPIFRLTREFTRGIALCRRTQFAATIAYVITIYKLQGLTVE